ncbi:MAG: hypothetical protein OXE86_11225 [Alphaproteobacteria bacterium]|nr:hypothetical protein [Alphaproteobacteria bacterium]
MSRHPFPPGPEKRLVTAAEFLQAYSEGRIDSRETMHGIGVDSFSDLLDAMAGCGFRLPRGRGREEQVEREVAAALPMLAEALGVPLPGTAPE